MAPCSLAMSHLWWTTKAATSGKTLAGRKISIAGANRGNRHDLDPIALRRRQTQDCFAVAPSLGALLRALPQHTLTFCDTVGDFRQLS
jgi:hypothetical protein